MRTEPERQEVAPPPAVAPILIRLDEAARLLGVSVKWIRAHRRQLPFVRELAPRVLRVDEAAMRRWVERRRA